MQCVSIRSFVIITIRLGYTIQFARRLPRFSSILFTSAQGKSAAVLQAEVTTLLPKGAIEPVPPAEMKKGFHSPYFIGDQGWFMAIDLKDVYFCVSILPRQFAFEGQAFQYKVLSFGLSLTPCVFTKIVEAALAPLREGCGPQPPSLNGTSGQLGKEQTLPGVEYLFSQCGIGLGCYDCTPLTGSCTVGAEVHESTQTQNSGSSKIFSEAPGTYGILNCGNIKSLRTTQSCRRFFLTTGLAPGFDQAQVVLFPSPAFTYRHLWYGLTKTLLGTDALAHSWPGDLCKHAFSPDLILGARTPVIDFSLAHSSEEGPPLPREGYNLAPMPRSLEAPFLVPGRDKKDFRDLPSTVVYVAAISANHKMVEGRLVGKHNLVIRVLRGAQRLNPPRLHFIPSWDLSVVLQALQRDPSEPLQSGCQCLEKTAQEIRAGRLSCHPETPAWIRAQVSTTPFRDQVVTLQAIPFQEGDPNLRRGTLSLNRGSPIGLWM
ncbi:Gag-Pro-Pol polyprotein [Labeo rohita]|uniref:Gag-Pro-Pol polyprotein n=1 Tax=Labeo rohita TaxID=84645 RepID=A0ABQ8L3N4_LABRO|nr:Gag-Pro-Pol polyprotein [Labeo rohita]